MSFNGSGTYSLPAGNPVSTGTTISSTWANTTLSDIATGLTTAICKDGQSTPTANLPMGGYRHTGAGAAVNTTDYARADQTQNSAFQWLTTVAGTDTITASATPTPAAYAAGQTFRFVSAGANTTTSVTLNVSGLGAKSITKNGSTALAAGDIPSGALVEVTYDGTQFQAAVLKRGTAAGLDVGTSANNVVQLDGSAKLPAVDGSQLTNVGSSQLQPISASVGSNALTISASALSLDFRSTTLGSGAITRVSGTPANLVISSGSTLGTSNGVQSDIAVLAINNAGTIELAAVNAAGGVDLSETGLISTTAEGGAGAADSATVIYSTTARTSVAYRVIGIIRSTQATAGTWATAPSLIQGAGGQFKIPAPSMVRLNTANGYGSTNTKIRRFTNVVTNQGSDITYADSATLGASFTINTNGVYAISFTDCLTTDYVGISLNSSQLTTSIAAITAADQLANDFSAITNGVSNVSWQGYLAAGSVIRAHTGGAASGTGATALFTITRVA